ncbi:spore coat protein [Metabacillus herbersteinensis]|uniref:Spore coat protein n=1 Tax=Metabacillus herbersteinensis TaxID=283816 RepID=A0ABV6GGA7_9BACI
MSSKGSKRKSTVDPYHAFLESLKGRVVKVYRGGPESKTGTLLDVQSDYVALLSQNNDNSDDNSNDNKNNNNKNNNKNNNQNNNQDDSSQDTVVYYHIKHVKSISEDSKSNSTQVAQSEEENAVEFLQAENFTGVIEQFGNKYIQINQGGPESKNGLVIDVIDDYIIMFTEDDGVVYFNVDHVKSIYEYNQNDQNDNDQNQNQTQNQNQVVIPSFDRGSDFHDLFGHMSHKWVSINRGGPEAMEGVLVENSGGHYTLVSNEEVLRINPYHIRSISAGAKGSLSNNNNNNNNNNNDDQQDQSNGETNQANQEEAGTDNENKDNSRSGSKDRRSSRRIPRETVVKTIDYKWVPK